MQILCGVRCSETYGLVCQTLWSELARGNLLIGSTYMYCGPLNLSNGQYLYIHLQLQVVETRKKVFQYKNNMFAWIFIFFRLVLTFFDYNIL